MQKPTKSFSVEEINDAWQVLLPKSSILSIVKSRVSATVKIQWNWKNSFPFSSANCVFAKKGSPLPSSVNQYTLGHKEDRKSTKHICVMKVEDNMITNVNSTKDDDLW